MHCKKFRKFDRLVGVGAANVALGHTAFASRLAVGAGTEIDIVG
jgi:hypothetical protein